MNDIDVVVPTHNRAALIGQTIDAIAGQSMQPAAILVVDDGSQDATPDILAAYGDAVRVLRQRNQGDLVARNAGLRAAAAPLVAFCDSDDVWEPDFLACMFRQFEAEPNMVACYANFRVLRHDAVAARSKFQDAPVGFWQGLRQTGPDRGVFDEAIIGRLLEFQPFFPSCMMVRREAFIRIGGWDDGVGRVVGGDMATALRAAGCPPMGVVQTPLVRIRKHGGNFSADTEKMNLGDASVLDYAVRTRPELAALGDAFARSAARRRRQALDSAFGRGDLAAVSEIARLLDPKDLSPKQRLKRLVAAAPPPVNRLAGRFLARRG